MCEHMCEFLAHCNTVIAYLCAHSRLWLNPF